jgi:hypothetical protein
MMTTRWLLLTVALLSTVSMARPAAAQRFSGRSTNSLTSLAANDSVQKHLGIAGDAAARLNALGDEYRAASQKEFTALGIDYSALGDLPAAERAVEMRKVNEKTAQATRKLTADFMPKLEQWLTPDQMERLKQIQLQASGVDLWTEPAFAKELELTDEQVKKITALRDDYNRRQQQLDGDFQQRFARIRDLNAERDTKALDLLTSAQREKLIALKGPPFDVSQLGFGRRRGNN